MNIQLAYRQLTAQLFEIYESREASNIADLVIEHVTGQRKIERIVYKDLPVTEEQQMRLERIADELLTNKPVQYVLGEAWFKDMKFLVNENVLIPRPETEELVDWILKDARQKGKDLSILDIGTGSGCIAIAIKKELPAATVSAIDVSDAALQTALSNSTRQSASVDFLTIDFLHEEEWKQLGAYDLIVSNPPYVTQSENEAMRENVVKYEPHIALFVSDEDPLIFYRKIAKFAQKHLKHAGSVYVEINECLSPDVIALFRNEGFAKVILKQDVQGKDRMVKAFGQF